KGPQQPTIVITHATLVFGQADVDQLADVDIGTDLLRAGHGEIVVLYAASHIPSDADAFPDEKQPDGEHFQLEERPPPKRHVPPVPRSPVDEEQNVTGFLLNDRLEGVDELRRKEPGTLGGFEKTEGEEAVDALAVSGHHEGPLRVAA